MRTKLALIFTLLAASVVYAAPITMTVADFSDPTTLPMPMFSILQTGPGTGVILSGWDDSQTGLNLHVPVSAVTFANSWYEMTPLPFIGSLVNAVAGAGTIKFHADGDLSSAAPIFQIDFASAHLTFGGVGSSWLTGDGVVFSGTAVSAYPGFASTTMAFSFANQTIVERGFEATAAFTSSGMPVPEPVTIAFCVAGSLFYARRRR
jgi:hypothetical protein